MLWLWLSLKDWHFYMQHRIASVTNNNISNNNNTLHEFVVVVFVADAIISAGVDESRV